MGFFGCTGFFVTCYCDFDGKYTIYIFESFVFSVVLVTSQFPKHFCVTFCVSIFLGVCKRFRADTRCCVVIQEEHIVLTVLVYCCTIADCVCDFTTAN